MRALRCCRKRDSCQRQLADLFHIKPLGRALLRIAKDRLFIRLFYCRDGSSTDETHLVGSHALMKLALAHKSEL